MNDKETIISLLNEFANPEKMASFFLTMQLQIFYSLDQVVIL